jgi:hypothetical protein
VRQRVHERKPDRVGEQLEDLRRLSEDTLGRKTVLSCFDLLSANDFWE